MDLAALHDTNTITPPWATKGIPTMSADGTHYPYRNEGIEQGYTGAVNDMSFLLDYLDLNNASTVIEEHYAATVAADSDKDIDTIITPAAADKFIAAG